MIERQLAQPARVFLGGEGRCKSTVQQLNVPDMLQRVAARPGVISPAAPPSLRVARRSRDVSDRPNQDQWIITCWQKSATLPEGSSFEIDGVDQQRSATDEFCGRDAALERMLH